MESFIYLNLFCMTSTQPFCVLQTDSQSWSSKEAEVNQAWTSRLLRITTVLGGERCIHAGKWIKYPFPRHFFSVYVNMCAGETTAVSLPRQHRGEQASGHLGLEVSLNGGGVNLPPMCWRGRQFLSGPQTHSQINKVNSKHSHSAIWNQPFNELLFL